MVDVDDLMARFGRAFVQGDRAALAETVTDDFTWHLHEGAEAPHAKTVVGVDAALGVIEWRKANWSDLRYSDVDFRCGDEHVTQTFQVSGTDENGQGFDVRAVDLYTVLDGRVASKDSYWKRIGS